MDELNQQQSNTGNSYISPEEDRKQNHWLPAVMKSLHIFTVNWKWFLLSAVVCLFLAYLYQAKQERVYERTATIAIKGNEDDSRNKSVNMTMNGVGTLGGLNDETVILKSHRLMRRVVKALGLDVSYTTDMGLREYSLYKESPVKVTFFKPFSGNVTFDIEVENENSYRIHNITVAGQASTYDKTAPYGKVIDSPAGAIMVDKNPSTLRRYMKRTVRVARTSMESAALAYTGCINAVTRDQSSNLITVICHDTNVQRADDIIATLLKVYKEDIIETKNRKSISADKFLTQRIQLIGGDLNSTENRIAFARQAYNDAVTEYNTKRELFPTSIVAGMFNFDPAALLESTDSAAQREAPQVKF